MHTLLILGGFALDQPTAPTGGFVSQRAGAVLAVLAVAGELGCTRGRLVGLFWPESTDAFARHSLRDELYRIRQALGADAILAQGDTLRLNPACVASDVQQFDKALAAGAWSDAVGVYRGLLLAGFHLDNAPEFEHWLERERARLFRECKSAIEALAAVAERAAKWRKAAEWWGRALELDPYDTRLVVRRVLALAHSGDRANAIMEGEEHRRLLKKEMELDPDPAFLEELMRIRRGDFGRVTYLTPGETPSNATPAPPPRRAR
jgi:DNA-binding SARP family transcriptional activator